MKLRPHVMVLSSVLDDRPRLIELDRPMTVGEIVASQNIRLDLPTIAVASGFGEPKPVLRGEWHVRVVRPGETLSFVPVPGRGGLTSILAAIAGIALAIFAPWAAGWIAGALFPTLAGNALTMATSAIAAGIMLAGQFIINRLMPAPGREMAGAETVYTARASSNRAMPNETIPVLYGRLRYPPPYAARPYAEFIDNDQHLYQLHCMSAGHVDVESWEIGDTLVWTKAGGFTDGFDGDTEIEIVEPGGEVTLFPANVVTSGEVSGQTVPDPPAMLGPFAVNPPGTEITRIVVDYVYPFGLGWIDGKGNIQTSPRGLTAEYRRIDDAGQPLGAWAELFTQNDTGRTRTPIRKSRGGDVAAGRYEVRLVSDRADLTDWSGEGGAYMNRIAWAGLRGYLEGFETPPGVTLIATKIRATEHLSQNASGRYFFTGTRKLPVWSGGQWTAPQPTRAIAWAAADMLRNEHYGLGVAESDYDRAWLATYNGTWSSRGDHFDAIFDRRWPAGQALDAILRAGRAYHVRLGSVIGFVRDEPRQVRRMAFTPDTIVKGSFRREDIWFSEEAPDHLEVTYLDGESWRDRSVICAIGAIGTERPQQISIFGITDHDHAWREGIFQAAENAYRRSFRTFQVEREGRMLVRGDAVVLSDPIYDLIAHARVESLSGQMLTLDRPVTTTDLVYADNVHIVLRDKRGREWGPCRVNLVQGAEVTLTPSARTAVEAEHGLLVNALPNPAHQEAAHATLLREGESRFNGLLLEARPMGQHLWEVVLVNDDPRVHEADGTEVKPSPWTPPPVLPPVPERPKVEGLNAWIAPQGLTLHLEAGWQPAAGADRYECEISYEEGAEGNPEAADWTPVQDSKATKLSVTILPQAVTLRVAAIGQKRGPWVYKTISDHPSLYPPKPGPGEDDWWADFIDQDRLRQDVKDAQRRAGAGVREAFDEILKLSQAVVEMASNDAMERAEIRRGVATEFGEARSSFEELIVAATGPNSALVARMNLFDAALEGKASVELLEQTTLLVQENKDSILALGTQLTQFELELEGKASASQLAATILKVEENEQGIEALGDSLSELGVTVGKFSAAGRFRTTVEATPSGAQARIGISAAASDGASTSQAAIFLDALAGGLSQAVLAANRTMITDSQGNLLALFDEVSGQTVIAKARIKDLDADNITVDKLDAAVILQDGTLLTDIIADNAVSNLDAVVDVAGGIITTVPTQVAAVSLTDAKPNSRRRLQFVVAFETSAGGSVDYPLRVSVRVVLRRGTTVLLVEDVTYFLQQTAQTAQDQWIYSGGASFVGNFIDIHSSTAPGYNVTLQRIDGASGPAYKNLFLEVIELKK